MPAGTGGTGTGGDATGGTGAGGITATGGTAGSGSGTGGAPGPKATYELIEDAEDNDGRIVNANGHQGPWHSFNSGGGNQVPSTSGPFKPESGGANSSMYAVHTTGDGYSYAGVGFDLNNSSDTAESMQSMSFDASKFDGLAFYAKGTGKIRVEFPMRDFVPKSNGGACDSNCWNVYGDRSLQGALTTSWQEYKIPFAKLARESGDPKPAFDASQLMGIAFKQEGSDKFDFWLDDIRFYKEGAAAGAGAK